MLSNKPLLLLALVVAAAQLAAVYLPALQVYLNTTPLTLADLALSIGLGAIVLVYAEIEKVFKRRAEKQP